MSIDLSKAYGIRQHFDDLSKTDEVVAPTSEKKTQLEEWKWLTIHPFRSVLSDARA